MAENPFAAAIVKDALPSTVKAEPKPFIDDGSAAAFEYHQRVTTMSRQELLENGYLAVQDMDDEELRVGRCRNSKGHIVSAGARTKMLPRDLYDAMVAEHLQRTQEKLRGQMDVALGTMIDVMTDDTVEPDVRLKASQYLYERVAGKTPERVSVSVRQEPWEEVIGGISQMTRAQSKAMREGAIDAEVVEDPVQAADERSEPNPTGPQARAEQGEAGDAEAQFSDTARPSGGAPTGPIQGTGGSPAREVPADAPGAESLREPTPAEIAGIVDPELMGDLRIQPATEVPNAVVPESTSATAVVAPPTNADMLRARAAEAKELAERRKAARKKIQDAKKKRAIKRATGQDALQPKEIKLTENNGRIQFKIN